MNCRHFDADLVDAARGVHLDSAAELPLRDHLDACPACTARLERERHLTRHLGALASAAEPQSPRAAALEQDLLQSFAAMHAEQAQPVVSAGPVAPARPAVPPSAVASARPAFPSSAARPWLALAATLVVATGLWWVSAQWRSGTRPDAAGQAQSIPAQAQPTPAQASITPAVPEHPAPAASPVRPAMVTTTPAAARTQAPPSRPPARNEVMQFVTLPSAVGMPALESGRIVRVEVPTSMLPSLGFDIGPDTPSALVEADVLVGQDGQARAIRFVSLESRQRRQ